MSKFLAKLSEFLLGFVQGMVTSNMLFFLPTWQEHFGDSQHNPLSGDDGGPFTRVKYLGRLMGAALIPYMLLFMFITVVVTTANLF